MASSSMDYNIQASSSTERSSNDCPNGHPMESLIPSLNYDLLGLAVHNPPHVGLQYNHLLASDEVFQPISTMEEDEERMFHKNSPSKLRTTIQTQNSSASALSSKESPRKDPIENCNHDQDDVLLDMAPHSSAASFKPHCRSIQGQKPDANSGLFKCPVHNVVVLNNGGAYKENAINVQQRSDKLPLKTAHAPLERYLAEGVAERYALLSLEQIPERSERVLRGVFAKHGVIVRRRLSFRKHLRCASNGSTKRSCLLIF